MCGAAIPQFLIWCTLHARRDCVCDSRSLMRTGFYRPCRCHMLRMHITITILTYSSVKTRTEEQTIALQEKRLLSSQRSFASHAFFPFLCARCYPQLHVCEDSDEAFAKIDTHPADNSFQLDQGMTSLTTSASCTQLKSPLSLTAGR